MKPALRNISFNLPGTLWFYLSRQFLLNFLLLFIVLLSVIYLFDTVELLRRASKIGDIPFTTVTRLSLLKLPEVGQLLFPFAVLFAAMFTFWRLTRTSELVVVRAAGFSAWQFLGPIIMAALLLGVVRVTVINPVGAVLLGRYEQLENKYFSGRTSLVNISASGLWLRQADAGGDGYMLFHASRLDPVEWTVRHVHVFFFNDEDAMTRRIDAEDGTLKNGIWTINNAVISRMGHDAEKRDSMEIPTEMTRREIEDSFASPETLSFWSLPEFIATLEKTGFSATNLKMYFQALIAQPFLYMSMVLLAAAVSLRPPRQGGATLMILFGVAVGFSIFLLDNILQAFGISQQIPVWLAAWAPATISFLLGVAAILHMEDG